MKRHKKYDLKILSIILIIIASFMLSQKVKALESNPVIERVLKQASASKAKNVKLYACQILEDRMKKDVNDLATLTSTMVANMNVYTSKIVKYYNAKFTPKGLFVTNIQEFVDITNKNESSNKESLKKISEYIKNISCANINAKNNLKNFDDEMNKIINALNQSKIIAQQIVQQMKDQEESAGFASTSASSK